MIGKLETVVLDAQDIAGLSAFYRGLAGWKDVSADAEWITLETPDGWRIALQAAPDRRAAQWPDPASPQQFHLDVRLDDFDAAEQAVLALGARRLAGGGTWFRVYADPANKPFCLTIPE